MSAYPVTFAVDYPDRPLDRLSSFFRIFMLIPIAVLVAAIVGFSTGGDVGGTTVTVVVGGIGLLFLPVLLMIVFRNKYPRWWFDWNLELQRLTNRVGAYALLMDDHYPATDAQQGVRLNYAYPDVEHDLGRGMPLVKWLLAIPHYVILAFLHIGVLLAVVAAWF